MMTRLRETLPRLAHGDHCCLFFDSPEQHGKITANFLGIGLERGERCVFVGGPDSVEAVRAGLKDAGVDVEKEAGKDRLILTASQDYLDDGRWRTDKMLAFLQNAYDSTLAGGFSALRAVGDVSLQVGPREDYGEVVYYEALLDLFFAGKRMVGMCQYPKDRVPAETLRGVLGTHRLAAIGPTLCENSNYVPPGILVEKDETARERKRVEWMTAQLVRVTQAEAERDRLQQELLRAQKREAIGRLAGGVAHDFNNVLTAMIGLSDLIVNNPAADKSVVTDAQEIRLAGERASALTRQLLALSRRQAARPAVVDLNEVVQGMGNFLRRIIGERVRVETALAPGLGRVRADIGHLEQILLNLVVNARDAMPSGGTVTIATADAEPDRVTLRVRDTGAGIDPAVLPRIWEPFFTTKDATKGTGLGLSTVREIVEQCGGSVAVSSEPGKGAEFAVSLPRVSGPAERLAARTPEQAAPLRGSETVLLVEDEDTVRRLVTRILAANGYAVIEARGAAEALRACERHPEALRLLISDVVLGEGTGRDLARKAAGLRPGLKVLLVSGYGEGDAGIQPGEAFLQKPFSPEALLRRVRALLDA
ncbi:MAG: MEDS domain-containing protein [Elusimicrobia bacterium]|nr:MEDS domain-containing protein [Elusimicrobiota bacterium]